MMLFCIFDKFHNKGHCSSYLGSSNRDFFFINFGVFILGKRSRDRPPWTLTLAGSWLSSLATPRRAPSNPPWPPSSHPWPLACLHRRGRGGGQSRCGAEELDRPTNHGRSGNVLIGRGQIERRPCSVAPGLLLASRQGPC
jgi:hypothetical protein